MSSGSPLDIMRFFNRVVDDLDMIAAAQVVADVRAARPDIERKQLIDQLISQKSRKVAAVGAMTSGAAAIPGLGTLLAMSVGVAADIGLTFKMQAELILEIAAAHGRELSLEERRRAVMLVTGIGVGAGRLAEGVGRRAALAVGERFAERWIIKAIPFVSIAASAGINALVTYVVGKRAEAYFALPPEQVADRAGVIRALSGIDERAAKEWMRRLPLPGRKRPKLPGGDDGRGRDP